MPDKQSREDSVLPTVVIQLPRTLQAWTGGRMQVSIEGRTIQELFNGLEAAVPGVCERILEPSGTVRRHVNIYLNDSDIRYLDGLDTRVDDADVVWVIPALAGG